MWLGMLTAWRSQGSWMFSMSLKQEYSSNKEETVWLFVIHPQKSLSITLPTLLAKIVTRLFRVKGKGIRLSFLMGETSRSHCTRVWGMRDTIVASSGKYHLPQSLKFQGTELPYQPQPLSLEFEWKIHFWLILGNLIFGLCCSELITDISLHGEKWKIV